LSFGRYSYQKLPKNIKNQSPSPSVILVFCSGGAFFKVFGLFLIGKSELFPIRKCVSSSHFCYSFKNNSPLKVPRRMAWAAPGGRGCASACGLGTQVGQHHRGQRAGVGADDAL
jgi:Tfp pilus assembly protein PilZ